MAVIKGKLVWDTDPLACLNGLKPGVVNRIMRKAVRAGAKPVRNAAKAGAPNRSGATKSSLSTKVGTSKKGSVYAIIGSRRDYEKTIVVNGKNKRAIPAIYAYLILYGARSHALGKGSKLAKAGKKDAKMGKQVGRKHPGMKGKNFLQEAFDRTVVTYQKEVGRVVGEEFNKYLAKQKGKKK